MHIIAADTTGIRYALQLKQVQISSLLLLLKQRTPISRSTWSARALEFLRETDILTASDNCGRSSTITTYIEEVSTISQEPERVPMITNRTLSL